MSSIDNDKLDIDKLYKNSMKKICICIYVPLIFLELNFVLKILQS